MIEPGIYREMTNDEYHNGEGISRSKLMDFAITPYRYWALHINPNRPAKKPKKFFELGQALHDMIMLPNFDDEYAIEPQKVLLKDVGRETYDAYKSMCEDLANCGKIILSLEDWTKLDEMRDRLYNHKHARELIEGAIYESSYFWIDKESGLLVKTRPDIIHENMSVDLKSTKDVSPHSFRNSIAQYGYHTQAAFIRDARRELENKDVPNFLNVCIEKEYPYHIGVYLIDEAAIEYGHCEYKQSLLDMKACLSDNHFPDYEVQTIGLPTWY